MSVRQFFNYITNFMLTETMSTDVVQPIKYVHNESGSNYLQFGKMIEHALTPTRESADLQGSPFEAPFIQQFLPEEKKLYRPTCKLKYRMCTIAESLR